MIFKEEMAKFQAILLNLNVVVLTLVRPVTWVVAIITFATLSMLIYLGTVTKMVSVASVPLGMIKLILAYTLLPIWLLERNKLGLNSDVGDMFVTLLLVEESIGNPLLAWLKV